MRAVNVFSAEGTLRILTGALGSYTECVVIVMVT